MGNDSYIASRLRPYQAEFVHQFMSGDAGKHVLLVHHVGMGATFTAMEVVRQHIAAQGNARVLVLGSSLMLEQWHEQLAESGVDADLIDRYRYRELQDISGTQQSIWDRSRVVLMQPDYGKYEDVLASLTGGDWTLIVAIDSHRLLREGRNLLEVIRGESPRARLLLLSPFYVAGTVFQTMEPLSVVRWEWRDIAGQLGRDRNTPLTLDLQFLEYELNEAELELRRQAIDLRQYSGRAVWSSYVPAGLLLNAFESSPAAFEDMLRRYRNRVVHGLPSNIYAERGSLVHDVGPEAEEFELRKQAEWLHAATKCIEAIETLQVDHKMDALITALQVGPLSRKDGPIYILTEFRPTMFYVQARLEEMGIESVAFRGSQSPQYWHENITEWKGMPGVFLATNAMLNERFDLSFIDRVVFYDAPRNEMVLHRVLSQLGMQRRTKRLSLDVVIEKHDMRLRSKSLRHVETVSRQWGFQFTVDSGSNFELLP